MAKKKKVSEKSLENLKKEKYKFDVADFLVATEWEYTKPGKKFFDDDFLAMLDFYVLHSPCKKGSYSPITFDAWNMENIWLSSKIRNRMDEIAGFNDENFIKCDKQHKFKETWEESGMQSDFWNIKKQQFALFTDVDEGKNKYMNLFHHIRNSFAHGRFRVEGDHGDYYIYFEDAAPTHGYDVIVGRMCLKKSTLINWMKFLLKTDEQ